MEVGVRWHYDLPVVAAVVGNGATDRRGSTSTGQL